LPCRFAHKQYHNHYRQNSFNQFKASTSNHCAILFIKVLDVPNPHCEKLICAYIVSNTSIFEKFRFNPNFQFRIRNKIFSIDSDCDSFSKSIIELKFISVSNQQSHIETFQEITAGVFLVISQIMFAQFSRSQDLAPSKPNFSL
jgi:hypothetical protein